MAEKWTRERVEEVMLIAQETLSLNDTISKVDDGDEVEIGEYIVDPNPTPEDRLLVQEKCDRVREVMTRYLKPREQEVIKMRFGFDGPVMTLEEIGAEFNITRERVRQIEARAKRKLMVYLRKHNIGVDDE